MYDINALVLSDKVIAAHQVAALLTCMGLRPKVVAHDAAAYTVLAEQRNKIMVFAADIESPNVQGMAAVRWHQSIAPLARWYAICGEQNSLAMRMASRAHTEGYFYLNNAGMSINRTRGMAREITYHKTEKRITEQSLWVMPDFLMQDTSIASMA